MNKKIDMRAFAQLMLDYEQAQRRADELRQAIEDTVLQMEQSQQVGNVKATYSSGRKSYDYEAAARAHPGFDEEMMAEFTKVRETVDWRKICEYVAIRKEKVPFTKSAPSVRVKLL